MTEQTIEIGQHRLRIRTYSNGGVELTWWLRGRRDPQADLD